MFNATQAAAYLWAHRRFYGFLFLGLGASAIGSYSFISWTVTVLVRSYGLSVGSAGFKFGLIGLAAGAAAAAFWPWLSAYVARRMRPSRLPWLLAGALGTGQILMSAFGVATGPAGLLTLTAAAAFCFAAIGTLPVLLIQYVTPAGVRARVVSLYVLFGNLIGLVVGPTLTAVLATRLFDGPDAMRLSLALLGAVLAPTCAAMLVMAGRGYADALLPAGPQAEANYQLGVLAASSRSCARAPPRMPGKE